MKNRGFSLVELSIVLVILGLLVGGVLAGQSLIRSSQLRSVVSEQQRFAEATQSFRDQYNGIPGDLANAQSYWGVSTACGGASATGTCNGTGDNFLSYVSGANGTAEQFQFWRQLSLAGMIEGNYTGTAGPAGSADSVIGTNSPKSHLSHAGWSMNAGGGVYAGDSATYSLDYGNGVFDFGAQVTGTPTLGSVLTPAEAWGIDSKMDDGLPGSGKVIAFNWNHLCANASSNTDYASPYNLGSSTVNCALFFIKAW